MNMAPQASRIEERNMLLINCPWCGPRDEIEFRYGGEAHIDYPWNAAELTDEQWAETLFMRTNPKGNHHERWNHTHGCRRWFNVVRDTRTHIIQRVYQIGSKPKDKTASEDLS